MKEENHQRNGGGTGGHSSSHCDTETKSGSYPSQTTGSVVGSLCQETQRLSGEEFFGGTRR